MRVSRTRFSKRRLKRKTEFPIIAIVQKKRKARSSGLPSFSNRRQKNGKELKSFRDTILSSAGSSAFSGGQSNKQTLQDERHLSIKKKQDLSKPQKKSRATIDYKNVILLRSLITAEGKILPRRINKLTAKQQRSVQRAIKTARVMGLVPFINKSRPV